MKVVVRIYSKDLSHGYFLLVHLEFELTAYDEVQDASMAVLYIERKIFSE